MYPKAPSLTNIKKVIEFEKNTRGAVRGLYGCRCYYNSVKFGARLNVSDAKVIYDDLRKRFNRSGTILPTNGTDA